MKLVNIEIIKDELERLIRNYRFYSSTEAKYRYESYKELSEWLDGLEVEEVDLEEEMNKWRQKHFEGIGYILDGSGEWLERTSQLDIARHFYELGLKTKGE